MSGNNYQTYRMQRVGKQSKEARSGRGRIDLPVRISVSESLGRKIRRASVKTRLPEQVIAGEAMTCGFALLNS
jgi:hypothetical protein